MTRIAGFYTTAVLVLCLMASAAGQSAKAALTNKDVEHMLSQGLTEDVVIQAISANGCNFDVSPEGLLGLKQASVPDKVVQAMLAAESRKRELAAQRISAAAQQPARSEVARGADLFNPGMQMPNQEGLPTEVQLPKVTLIVDDQRQVLNPSGTAITTGKGKGGSAAGSILKGFGKSLLIAGNMAGAPVPTGKGRGGPGMPNVGRTWALPGRNSTFTIKNQLPKFEVEFGDIPGVDPDGYEPVLLKLTQTKDNWRLVSSSKDKFDKHGNDTRSDKIKPEDKVEVAVSVLGRGHIVVAPAGLLPTGEYGLILHSKKAEKEYAGVTNANADAIFYSVWDFSMQPVNGAPVEQKP